MTAEPMQFHRHLIRATQIAGGWKGAAFRADRLDGGHLVRATYGELVAALTDRLDSARSLELAARGPDGYPTTKWVRDALAAIKISDSQRKMLEAHIRAPDCVLTATQLAVAAGYTKHVTANSQYGTFGKRLAEEMEWMPRETRKGVPCWTLALADDAASQVDGDRDDAHWQWRLRPQVLEAWQSR